MMENHLFRQITPQNVETEIFARLRAAIVSGKIKPGERLVETDIARQMAVSRIPIREALSKLEQEGLVLRQPNKGCFVITFSEQDVLEVCSLRASLESMAFEWAIPKMTAQDIADLHALVERQERAIRMEDYDELAQLDMHFHEFICIKANHHRLLKAWYEQHAQCQMLLNLRFRQMAEYTPETVLVDHQRILAAIENNDPEAAIDLTLQISDRVARECVQTLNTLGTETAANIA